MVCRLSYVMDMMLIACELVIAVCTLVYLFSLQHSVDSLSLIHISEPTRPY